MNMAEDEARRDLDPLRQGFIAAWISVIGGEQARDRPSSSGVSVELEGSLDDSADDVGEIPVVRRYLEHLLGKDVVEDRLDEFDLGRPTSIDRGCADTGTRLATAGIVVASKPSSISESRTAARTTTSTDGSRGRPGPRRDGSLVSSGRNVVVDKDVGSLRGKSAGRCHGAYRRLVGSANDSVGSISWSLGSILRPSAAVAAMRAMATTLYIEATSLLRARASAGAHGARNRPTCPLDGRPPAWWSLRSPHETDVQPAVPRNPRHASQNRIITLRQRISASEGARVLCRNRLVARVELRVPTSEGED